MRTNDILYRLYVLVILQDVYKITLFDLDTSTLNFRRADYVIMRVCG